VLSSHHSNASSSSSNFGSRSRYSAYDYDLTTPQYTPDGRLLQVEYALNACRRVESNPIVSVGLCIPGKQIFHRSRLLQQQRQHLKNSKVELNEDSDSIESIPLDGEDKQGPEQGGDALIIMATISSPPPSSSSVSALVTSSKNKSDEEEQPDDSDSTNTSLSSNQRAQRRIIEVPLSTSFQTPHATTTTAESIILIGLSGILADTTKLLQIAYSILEEEQISFGWHRLGLSPIGTVALHTANNKGGITKAFRNNAHLQQSTAAQPSETAVRLSRAIGDKCQKHAFGGGLRPLGASLLVAGIDSHASSVKLAMCETEPSGAVSVINPYWATTPRGDVDHDNVMKPPQVMVSGGSIQTQSKLKRMMASRMRQIYREIGTDVESNERMTYFEEAFLRRALQTVIETVVEEWKDRGSVASSSDKKRQPISLSLPQMEVVFTTPRRGTFRLSEDDIKTLMETAENEHQTS